LGIFAHAKCRRVRFFWSCYDRMIRLTNLSLTIAIALLALTPLAAQDASPQPASPDAAAPRQIELIDVVKLPGDHPDRSGLDAELVPSGIPHNTFGGVSGIDYDARSGAYWVASDRGPDDGAENWSCRIHRLHIDAQPGRSQITLQETVLLKDPLGLVFSGSSQALNHDGQSRRRLDPEGIRLFHDGIAVSDEYGPQLLRFDLAGNLKQAFQVPDFFKVNHPHQESDTEREANATGRQPNRGMEGLGRSADGQTLFGLMQSPLIQDSVPNPKGKRSGLLCRLIGFESSGQACCQYAYELDDPSYKLNEILAIDETRFLTIERDGKSGAKARCKKIMLIDISEATDIGNLPALPADHLPPNVQPVKKSLFIDLLDSRLELNRDEIPEKIEGLTWGPELEDGRRLLVVAVDNDFELDQPTVFYLFAVNMPTSKARPIQQ